MKRPPVLQITASQSSIDIAAAAQVEERINQGLDDVTKGRTPEAREARAD